MLLVCGFYLDFTVSISFCKAKKQFFVKVKVRKDDDLAIIFLCCICEIDRIKNTRVIPYLKWDSSCRHAWISKGASYGFKIMDHEMNIGHCKEWASLVQLKRGCEIPEALFPKNIIWKNVSFNKYLREFIWKSLSILWQENFFTKSLVWNHPSFDNS